MLHFLACWHFFFFQVDRFPKGELESQNVHTHAYFNRYCWTAFPKGSNKSESCRSQRHFLHTTWAFRSKLWAQHMWSTGGLRQGPGLDSYETSVFKEKEKEHWVKRHEFLSISSSPIPRLQCLEHPPTTSQAKRLKGRVRKETLPRLRGVYRWLSGTHWGT